MATTIRPGEPDLDDFKGLFALVRPPARPELSFCGAES